MFRTPSTMLANIVYALAFVIGTSGLSVGVYLLTQRLTQPNSRDQHRDMASAMVSRIGALHGLILALVFAQELAAYQRLEAQTAVEASAVADIYNDAERYGDIAAMPLQRDMLTYLETVLDSEWAALGAGHGLSPVAWTAWDNAYNRVLDLVPTGARQTSLRDHMLDRLHAISASRDVRASEAGTSFANFFWFAALSGVLLIAVGHYIYPARRQSLIMLGLFSAYTGLILFLIFGLSNPFRAPAELDPFAMRNLAATLHLDLAAP